MSTLAAIAGWAGAVLHSLALWIASLIPGAPCLVYIVMFLWQLISRRRKVASQEKEVESEYQQNSERADSDPLFLLGVIQECTQEICFQYQKRVLGIQKQILGATVMPRTEADGLLGRLRAKRTALQGIPDSSFAGKEEVLGTLDESIGECERIIHSVHPEEGRIKEILTEMEGNILVIAEFPRRLEALKTPYANRAHFLSDLEGINMRLESLTSARENEMREIVSQLSSLRRDVGVAAKTVEDFEKSLRGLPTTSLVSLPA